MFHIIKKDKPLDYFDTLNAPEQFNIRRRKSIFKKLNESKNGLRMSLQESVYKETKNDLSIPSLGKVSASRNFNELEVL